MGDRPLCPHPTINGHSSTREGRQSSLSPNFNNLLTFVFVQFQVDSVGIDDENVTDGRRKLNRFSPR